MTGTIFSLKCGIQNLNGTTISKLFKNPDLLKSFVHIINSMQNVLHLQGFQILDVIF